MAKPFASSADTAEKAATVEEIADGVLAYTAEGDPNVGAIIGRGGVVAIDARATPVAARPWLEEIRRRTDKPIRYLVLTHYHAVRVLGASAFRPAEIVASRITRDLIAERGAQDWASEFRRMPRLAADPDSVPGLTWPTITFDRRMDLHLGDRVVELHWLGRGHTAGDIAAWLPDERILFSGDLVESEAALYMGDAHSEDWGATTLDNVAALGARALVPGRGAVVHGDDVARAIDQTRAFLSRLRDGVAAHRGSGLKATFAAVHAELAPKYGDWPIFEHCLPFNVKRVMDELDGVDSPVIWTAETDAAIWDEVHG